MWHLAPPCLDKGISVRPSPSSLRVYASFFHSEEKLPDPKVRVTLPLEERVAVHLPE